MTPTRLLLFPSLLLAMAATAQAKPKQGGEPHVGYVYPAGGQAGTTFRVMMGGQNIGSAMGSLLSGGGAKITVISQSPTLPRLEKEQTQEIRRRIELRRAALAGRPAQEKPEASAVQLPGHPLIDAIGEMNAQDLKEFETLFFAMGKKLPPTAQISRLTVLEISLAPDAVSGRREIRLVTRSGLSNPLAFEIGTLPEVCLPRVPCPNPPSESAGPLQLPATVNGQILPGKTRTIAFQGTKGSRFTANLRARSLIPYISDAVPGWFQAEMVLRDSKGREIAYDDDFLFQPDPILQTTLPEDGVYLLEIRDALYRGRQDFVFRVTLGDFPVFSGLFPLGARQGTESTCHLMGPAESGPGLKLDTSPAGPAVRMLNVPRSEGLQLPYLVGRWPEKEVAAGTPSLDVRPPVTLNGRLEQSPVQTIRFAARRGEKLDIEIFARRLGSPLDAALEIRGPDGKCLAASDDGNDKAGDLFLTPGLLTNQADPALSFTAPADGTYSLVLRDVSGSSGPLFAYRLCLAPPDPGFALAATPSAINFNPAQPAKVILRLHRKGGFTGPVRLAVDPPQFRITPSEIPAGANHLEAEITSNAPPQKPVRLILTGNAKIAGQEISREAMPVDDTMQAFLWRHLVPAQEFLAAWSRPPKQKNKP